MSDDNKSSLIKAAIRAKRERQSDPKVDLLSQEAALLADIEHFDLDAVERRSREEAASAPRTGWLDEQLAFPEIVDGGAERLLAERPVAATGAAGGGLLSGSLLAELRAEAEGRLVEHERLAADRLALGERIDLVLKRLFFYLHDTVQQLNVIKPVVPRRYPLIEDQGLESLAWQEGFVDYRTQPQSAGGFVELVSLSGQLARDEAFRIHRNSLGVERFRKVLFDYGLQFVCREKKDARGHLEAAEFEIPARLPVSVRWRADFTHGVVVLETRNLERLGAATLSLPPERIDQAFCEEFIRLLLGRPNRFRELATR